MKAEGYGSPEEDELYDHGSLFPYTSESCPEDNDT